MGFHVSEEEALRWEQAGIVPPGTFTAAEDLRKPGVMKVKGNSGSAKRVKLMVQEKFDMVSNTWTIPIDTYSISNSRDAKKLMSSKGIQRSAVCRVMGKNHNALAIFADNGIHRPECLGGPAMIIVCMTRLASRELDDDNLPPAMKYVRDAIADLLGINDKNPLVVWECRQELSARLGVRIHMRLA